MLAAWHASLEVGTPIANKDFLVNAFPALGENRREALRSPRACAARTRSTPAWPRSRHSRRCCPGCRARAARSSSRSASSSTAGTGWAPRTDRLGAPAALAAFLRWRRLRWGLPRLRRPVRLLTRRRHGDRQGWVTLRPRVPGLAWWCHLPDGLENGLRVGISRPATSGRSRSPGLRSCMRPVGSCLIRRTSRAISAEQHAEQVGVAGREEVIGCDLCGERGRYSRCSRRAASASRGVITSCAARVAGSSIATPVSSRSGSVSSTRAKSTVAFSSGKYDAQALAQVSAGARRLRSGLRRRHGPPVARLRLRHRPVPRARARARLRCPRRRPVAGLDPARTRAAQRCATTLPRLARSTCPRSRAGGFDVITLWSVHGAPREADQGPLEMLRGLLAPDGILLILTVNANSLPAQGRRAPSGAASRANHLKFFAPATLTRALHRAGFRAGRACQPTYSDAIEAGTVRLRPRDERRLAACDRRRQPRQHAARARVRFRRRARTLGCDRPRSARQETCAPR